VRKTERIVAGVQAAWPEGLIRVACFVGLAVMGEVHARVVHAGASDGSVPRWGQGTSMKGVL